jgi:hypothetical protein
MLKINFPSSSFLCLFILLVSHFSGAAQDFVVARVLASEGDVAVRRQSTGRIAVQNVSFKVEDQLFTGDTIVTGKNGRLVIGLSDGSQAVIAPKSTVILNELTGTPRSLFNIIKGKTRIQIEKRGGQPNPYKVNTPTAVIAVRGTIFDVEVAEEETQVYLIEGEVAVTNLAQVDRPVFLIAGQMTRVLINGLPRAPSIFKIGRNDGIYKLGRFGTMRVEGQTPAQMAGRGVPSSRGDGPPRQSGERNDDNRAPSSQPQSPKPSPGHGGGPRRKP